MSRFTGRQHKGAARELRAVRKREAEARNAASNAAYRTACGHVHGASVTCSGGAS